MNVGISLRDQSNYFANQMNVGISLRDQSNYFANEKDKNVSHMNMRIINKE